jgi:hypothetical protein
MAAARRYSRRASEARSCQWFETILVMKAGENRLRDDMVAVTNPMAARRHRNVVTFWNTWSQARVWTPSIVMRDPLPEDASEVPVVQRDQVQTLAANRANHKLTERDRLRSSHARQTSHFCNY